MPGAIGAAVIGLFGITVAATSTAALVVGNIILGAAAFGAQMLLGKPVKPGIKPSDVQNEIKQALSPRTKSYGRVLKSGVTFWLEVSRTNKKDLYLGLALNHGRIAAIDKYQIDDNEVEVAVDGSVITAPYSNKPTFLYHRLGEETESQYDVLETGFDMPNVRGDGVASLLGQFRNWNDATEQMENYPSGLPWLRVNMRASVCFDPREPLHDVNDPSTWTWSENIGVIILNYLIDPDGYGMHYSRVLPNLDAWIEQLNICDEDVALKGYGSEKRYRGAGTYDLTERPRDVVERMLAACDGRLWQKRDGSIGFTVGRFVEPTVTIESRDILSYKMERGQDPLAAIVGLRAQYTSPQHDFREHEAEAWPNGDAIVGLDEERIDTLDLIWSPSHGQTRRLMKREYKRRTAGWKGSISTNLSGLRAMDERYIHVVIDELGIDETFEVGKFTLDPSTLRCQIELLAVDSSIDEWDPETEEMTGDAPASREFRALKLASSQNSSTITIPACDVGAAEEGRQVFALVYFIFQGSSVTVTSATIGGVTGKVHALAKWDGSLSGKLYTALVSAPLEDGDVADVSIALSGPRSLQLIYCATFKVMGLQSDTPVDTVAQDNAGGSTHNHTIDVAGGGVVFSGMLFQSGSTIEWSGLTEDVMLKYASDSYISAASTEVAATQSDRSFSTINTNSSFGHISGTVAGSFR